MIRLRTACGNTQTIYRTWIATDACGNISYANQIISVVDTTPPTFVEELPGDVTEECDNVSAAATLTATDNCGEVTMEFLEETTDGACPGSYVITRTWTATDECGNEATHIQLDLS